MAGGMGAPRRPGRLTLAERSRISGVGQPGPSSVEHSAARHCWVVDPPGWPGKWPGLLLQWERVQLGWRGRVAFAVTQGGQVVLAETWLDSSHLQPA
jgi:hypothetical protein